LADAPSQAPFHVIQLAMKYRIDHRNRLGAIAGIFTQEAIADFQPSIDVFHGTANRSTLISEPLAMLI
jgi:hypothetical protein